MHLLNAHLQTRMSQKIHSIYKRNKYITTDQSICTYKKWIFFIKEAPRLDDIPESLGVVKEIELALNIANKININSMIKI